MYMCTLDFTIITTIIAINDVANSDICIYNGWFELSQLRCAQRISRLVVEYLAEGVGSNPTQDNIFFEKQPP